MKVLSLLIVALLLAGCASQEKLPPVAWHSDREALAILAQRAEQVRTIAAEGTITMRKADGQSVRLDLALAAESHNHLRLRAWKLGRAVFDVTMNPDGIWMLMPEDASIRKRIESSQANIKKLADSWNLFSGRFFLRSDLTTQDGGAMLIVTGKFDEANVRCEVEKRTLVPRRYVLTDDKGVARFTLDVTDYREITGLPFAQKYAATSDMGEILISLSDVELNAEPAVGAFVPPRRAEKLK